MTLFSCDVCGEPFLAPCAVTLHDYEADPLNLNPLARLSRCGLCLFNRLSYAGNYGSIYLITNDVLCINCPQYVRCLTAGVGGDL